jgi:hypothetical protein
MAHEQLPSPQAKFKPFSVSSACGEALKSHKCSADLRFHHGMMVCCFDLAGFVIARELRAECDPFGNDASLPDISSKGPYQKRKIRNLLPLSTPDFVPGEKEKRPKMPWKNPPRQHPVPKR